MPTRNRRRFVAQAILYFLRQDYPSRELIIVDDGEDSIADLVPQDPRIRYQHLPQRTPLGEKRNIACESARGAVVAHWDDDDWIAPQRLRMQTEHLLQSGSDLCGFDEVLHYRPETGEAWLLRGSGGPTMPGGTLVYRRSAWLRHPFERLTSGPERAFVERQTNVSALQAGESYITLLHPGNTSARNVADRAWERRPVDEIGRLLDFDRSFYATLRNRGYIRPVTPGPSRPGVTLVAPFMVYDGYGSMAEYLALGMSRAGAQVCAVPLDVDPKGLSPELQKMLDAPHNGDSAAVLYFCWVSPDAERHGHSGNRFINTMWETNRLPADWAPRLNRARAVLAPTRFVADVCRASGVTAPVEVVPQGVDPAVYFCQPRPERPGLTTLIVGTVIGRKHVAEGVAAWKLAFDGDRDARLIIKARFHYGNYKPDDPRITFRDDNEATRGIAHYYRNADILLALGNEGFGLPLVEGMATGLPVIALDSEGQHDVCEDAAGLLLTVKPERFERFQEPQWGSCGVRGVPGVGDVAERLRWVAAHRDEARTMGEAASAWVHAHRDVWTMGPAALDVMERHLQPTRPLRLTRAMWVPSWQAACGIAEYAAAIAEHVPGLRIVKEHPEMARVLLLHVQHQDALFDSAGLTQAVQAAKARRVPVVVTEHSVAPQMSAWEADADALVALTPSGVARLRNRWKHKRVEHIPHGCPTWFPPRKRTRGRVLAAFGFLERHKGFWQLLDVLRSVPGTELLLFSYAKSPEIEAEWENAARGLPVRRIRDYLPVAEIARRLAAEADALVFWYAPVPHTSASGAVRVGLATGVPVLTTPTDWFEDVRSATYQPADLSEGVRRLLDDSPLREQVTAAARAYCHEFSWPRIAKRHVELWQSLDN